MQKKPKWSEKLEIAHQVFKWVFKPLTFLMITHDWNELESSAWSQIDRLSKTFTLQGINNLNSKVQMSEIMCIFEKAEKQQFKIYLQIDKMP